MGSPTFVLRLSKAIRQMLDQDSADLHISTGAYIRSILVTHLSYTRQKNHGVTHSVTHPDFHSLDRAVKGFILRCQNSVFVAASLPGKQRRDSLEELSWEAVLEAIKFAKAQTDPELRLLAMRVASSIMRTELAVLHEQDQAAVDELVDELEGDRAELAKKARTSANDKAAT